VGLAFVVEASESSLSAKDFTCFLPIRVRQLEAWRLFAAVVSCLLESFTICG